MGDYRPPMAFGLRYRFASPLNTIMAHLFAPLSDINLLVMIGVTGYDLLGAVELLCHNQADELVRKDER